MIRIFALSWALFFLTGCTVVQVDFTARKATVFRFASDAALETATYEGPDGHKVTIGGYSSTQRIDAIIKLLEVAR